MTKQRLTRNNNHGFLKVAAWLLLLFAAAFMTNSCTKDSHHEYFPVTEGEFKVIETVDLDMQDIVDDVMLLPDYPDLFDYHDFLYESTNRGDGFGPYIIRNQVVEYSSTDNHGNKIQLTGLMVHPISFKSRIYAPIVSFNHATQILKKLAPSKWKTAKYKDYENFPEAVLANIMAATYGWIIVMPDYQGMGNDVGENHPFCIRERLAASTADMVQVAINSTSRFKNPYVIWNEKTFLYGYSEGGFVTMAAARELEARNVKLSGVVCMSGPYDLTGTMIPVMLKDTAFPEPYFLPMVVVGYHDIYPQAFAYDIVLNEPYRTVLPQYTNGFYDEKVVNSKMPPDKILKKIFTVSFIDSLKNPASQAMKIFALNNSHTGWTPKSKIYLWHCINDDCVPFGNFVAAKKRFKEIGLTNVDYKEYPALPPKPEEGTVHARIAPRAFFEGSLWIFHQSK
jgi:predicted esterase